MSELPYTIIIGLEVHVQLATESKLFCGCSTRFGADPNTQICPLCCGMPGTLPVMNRRAFELSLRTAAALDLHIATSSKWDRKQYYYPDLPKGYQISQYDLPFSYDGYLDIDDPAGGDEKRRIGIIRAHLEEDAGKSMHDEVAGKADSRIDLNRTGTPLLEIVSEPDLRSPAEAKAYLSELKLLLTYLGVSDCNMQEGSLRVDANINLHVEVPAGKIATPIVEVKNMNSFRAVERALLYEVSRQWDLWQETGQKLGEMPKQTRGWDDAAQITRGQRSKEESSDYRYLPDPDLAPVTVSRAEIDEVQSSLGELPAALRSRLQENYNITPEDADVLVNQGRPLADFFVRLAELVGDGKLAANWIRQDVLRMLKEAESTIDGFPLSAERLAELLLKIKAGELDTSRGRQVLAAMVAENQSVEVALQVLGIEAVDSGDLESLCQELLVANPKIVADVQAGKQQAVGALIGQAKQKNPNVNPGQVRQLCLELIAKM
ncbi:MAG: Asp-tRNA(Asn)/Glu-tRNA(Gln) amidotransferase subunit GatB [Planctomycetes bacterium]|nr:Asp-tRNA(Asn)/Glu-tRNA(Gln) amidotransferase subunit GatB [Planctomycetota bacterium]